MHFRSVWFACSFAALLVGGCPPMDDDPDDNSNTNGNSNDNGNDNVGASPVSDEQRTESLDEIQSMLGSFRLRGDPDEAEQIAGLLEDMPEIAQVGIFGSNVLANFTDGETLVIVNNRIGLETAETEEEQLDGGVAQSVQGAPNGGVAAGKSDARRQATDLITRVPSAKTVHLVNAMGNHFRDSTGLFARWFEDIGYTPITVDGSVEGLRTGIKDVGVLYMSAHGAEVPPEMLQPDVGGFEPDPGAAKPVQATRIDFPPGDYETHFGLWTTTAVRRSTVAQYRAEVRAGKLVYAMAAVSNVPGVPGAVLGEMHFMITEKFVAEHWRCRSGALIYMDACSSANQMIVDACLGDQVKAAGYVGWTRDVFDIYSTPTARYFFDRTLGANEYQPRHSPPQRPYTANTTIAAMAELTREDLPLNQSAVPKGIKREPGDPPPPPPPPAEIATLVARYRADTADIVLLPAIKHLAVADLARRVTLEGDFSDEPGQVTLNGTPLPLIGVWQSSRLQCEIAPGQDGTVLVELAGRVSNPRRLTRWDLTLRRTQVGFDCPDCFYEATLNYTIRADVGDFRAGPEAAAQRAGATGSAGDADIEVTNAGGSYFIGQGSTITLTPNADDGAAVIGTCIGFLPPEDNNYIGACFNIRARDNAVDFSPTYLAFGLIRNYTGGVFDGTSLEYGVIFSGNQADQTLRMSLSPDYTIEAGQQTTGPNSYFEWDAADAQTPPSDDDPH